MSAITSTQAVDLERRLSVLEHRVGISRQRTKNGTPSTAAAVANNNSTISNFDSVDDRLAKLRVDLEATIAKPSSEAASSSHGSSHNSHGSNTNSITTASDHEQSWKEIQKLLRELDPGIALTHQQQPLLYKRQQLLASSDELTNDFGQLDVILKLLLSGTTVDGAEGVVVMGGANRGTLGGGGGASAFQSSANNTNSTTTTTSFGTTTPKKGSLSSLSSPQKQKQKQKKLQAKKDQEQQQQQQQDPQQHHASGSSSTLRLDQVTQAPILVQHMATSSINPSEQKRVETLRHTLRDLHTRTSELSATLRHFLECYHTATMAVSEKIVLADERILAAGLSKPKA